MDFETYCRRLRSSRRWLDGGLVIFHQVPTCHEPARRVAREYLAEGVDQPAVDLIAWHQTAGQGRQGRSWSSPAGAGLYASMIRRLEPSLIQTLPLIVPTALASALRDTCGIACDLKWPNDLMVDRRKLGGVLLDVISGGGESMPVAIVSFGINHGRLDAFRQPNAVTLLELGSDLTLDALAATCLDAVDSALGQAADLKTAVASYRKVSMHRAGELLECRLDDEATKVQGVFLGIDDSGLLRLEVEGQVRTLSVGRLVSP